jgi:hypothetical protein
MSAIVQQIKQDITGLQPVEALRVLAEAFSGKIIFSTSLRSTYSRLLSST